MENEKRILLNQILELTKEQTIALQEEDLERFEELVGARGVIMQTIDNLHLQNPELKEQTEELILKEIIAIDNQNREEFNKQFELVKEKLKTIREKKKRDNFYNNPYTIATEEGVFFDKR